MLNLYIIPEWFFNYSIILELSFFLITLFIGVYALKVYKLSGQRLSKLFGFGFIMISLSYIFGIITNFIFIYKISTLQPIRLTTYVTLTHLALYLHILFFLTGLVTLVYMATNLKNFNTFSLLLALAIIPITLTPSKLTTFQILSSILLIYINGYYLTRYLANESKKNLLVLTSFMLLLIVNITLIFAVQNGTYYVVADLISLIAYSLLLIKLIRIQKNE